MAELTKEWLKQTIAEYEANRDELPFGLDTNSAIGLQAFKLALASLEAEPVAVNDDMAYAFHHALSDSSLGSDEIEEIKTGLRAALANVSYPVTLDGWISCSERMPVIGELNWRTSFPLLVTCEIGVMPAYYGFVSVNGDRHYGFMESLKYGDDSGNHPQTNEYGLISNVTHWMPLPEPPF